MVLKCLRRLAQFYAENLRSHLDQRLFMVSRWSTTSRSIEFPTIYLASSRVSSPKSSPPVRHRDEAPTNTQEELENDDKYGRRKPKRGKPIKEMKEKADQSDEIEKLVKERQEKMLKVCEEKYGKEAASMAKEIFKEMDEIRKENPRAFKFPFAMLTGLIVLPIITIILINYLFSLFGVRLRPDVDYDHVSNTTWTYFIKEIVKSGQINKIIVPRAFPEMGNASNSSNIFVIMNPGAKASDGTPLHGTYKVRVPDLRKLEWKVRNAEVADGIPPKQWANIQWPNITNMALVITLIVFNLILVCLPLLFMARSFKNMGGFFDNMSSMMSSHTIRILDPSSKEGHKGLKVRFRDVAGLHEAKMEISEFVDYLRRPHKYTRLGARLPKGALLTGPPGCGKTLLAKALAAESSVPFLNVNGTEFVEMIGGLGASRVRKLFKEAKSRAPCIIYIDEIDAVGRKRQDNNISAGGGGNSEMEQTLNQLLVEMDGMDTANGIVVIGSTNRPDILDKALLRPGRFDRHVTVELPTLLERQEMFDLYMKRIKKENRITGISHRLAQLTPGFSGADIANVVNEAAIHAATEQKKMVFMEDIDYALEKIIAGPEKRSRTLVKEEREVVAFHESGHALVGWLLQHTEALLKVTIIPRTSAALGFAQYTPKDRKLFTKEELFDRMCMMLGGRAAENITFGRVTTGAQNDLEKVTKQANAMVKWYGMNDILGPLSFLPEPGVDERTAAFTMKPYSKRLGNLIDEEVSKLIASAYFSTEKLLRDNKPMLDKLAHALLERETLSYEDVKKLIGPPKYGEKNFVDLPEEVLPDPPNL